MKFLRKSYPNIEGKSRKEKPKKIEPASRQSPPREVDCWLNKKEIWESRIDVPEYIDATTQEKVAPEKALNEI